MTENSITNNTEQEQPLAATAEEENSENLDPEFDLGEMSGDNDATGDEEDFAAMFEESIKDNEIKVGRVVSGRIVQITDNDVIIDIGYKSEGHVPINQFRSSTGEITVNEGDDVDVFLERYETSTAISSSPGPRPSG